MRNHVLPVLCLGIALVFVSVQGSGAEEGSGAKDLFENKCSICHSIDRPKSKKKTQEGWETTVLRMKTVNGAPVTDEEAQTIIDYLSENYGS
jgi:cytochrome c5